MEFRQILPMLGSGDDEGVALTAKFACRVIVSVEIGSQHAAGKILEFGDEANRGEPRQREAECSYEENGE